MNTVLTGHYSYYRDGTRQDIDEPWRLLATPHSVVLQGQRYVDGHQVFAVNARYQDRQCRFMHLRWQSNPEQLPIGVSYWHRQRVLNWRFDHEQEARRLELPADSLLFPLIRAASGPLVQLLANGTRSVIVPRLHQPSAENFLHPLLSERSAKSTDEADQWRCFGGEYGTSGALYRLNAQGLTQGYDWATDKGLWQIKLGDLQQHKVFRGFKR